MILLRKKQDACVVGDYRPISLMHSVSKLVGKVLAKRLAPHLHRIVSRSQSAFRQFSVYTVAVHFHKTNIPMLFIKLDIAKAFDNVR